MTTTEGKSELTTSQINQSEAGPDIFEVNSELLNNTIHLNNFKPNPDSEKSNIALKFDSLNNLKESNSIEKNDIENQEKVLSHSSNSVVQVLDKLISLEPSAKETSSNVEFNLSNNKSDNLNSGKGGKDNTFPFNFDGLEKSVLEIELSKLRDLLVKQEKISQEKMGDYESHLAKLTGQTCVLQDQLKQAEEREKALVKKVNEQNQNQVQLSIVMQEYEKLISKLTAEIEVEKKFNKEKIEGLTAEKDSALVHLSNVEAAFTDVHQKYEKCKKVIEDYKKNEAKMKIVINDQSESLKIKENRLETIQAHANQQLENAHLEVERSKQVHEQEMARLRAMLRKTELKVISLQESLEQKIKENQELTTICDDLIEGKVSTH